VEDFQSNWHKLLDSFELEPGTYTIQALLQKITVKVPKLESLSYVRLELNDGEKEFENKKMSEFSPKFLQQLVQLKRYKIDKAYMDNIWIEKR